MMRTMNMMRGAKAKLGLDSSFKPLGLSARLLLVDKAMDTDGAIAKAIDTQEVHYASYDSRYNTGQEIMTIIREAHKQNNGLFASIAVANFGPSGDNTWVWATDVAVDMQNARMGMRALEPLVACMCAALGKTSMGSSHIDLLAPNLSTSAKKGENNDMIVELEKLYSVDFRASIRSDKQHSGTKAWKLSTDNNYNFGKDYFDPKRFKKRVAEMNALAAALRQGPSRAQLAPNPDLRPATPAARNPARATVSSARSSVSSVASARSSASSASSAAVESLDPFAPESSFEEDFEAVAEDDATMEDAVAATTEEDFEAVAEDDATMDEAVNARPASYDEAVNAEGADDDQNDLYGGAGADDLDLMDEDEDEGAGPAQAQYQMAASTPNN